MKVGDKIMSDDFPASVATITSFEMQKKSVKKKRSGAVVDEIRTKYRAKFDGTSIEFTFYGFDIGRKIHPCESCGQLEIFDFLED